MEAATSPGAVLAVRDLAVRYPGADAAALDGVGFEVGRGELVGLVGAGGAGKSTLCRAVAGVLPQLLPASVEGRVRVAGVDPWTTPPARLVASVGLALDEPAAQLSQATAGEEAAIALESLAVPPDEMHRRVTAMLERLGLGGLDGRDPETLSGGQQQRLLLASVLVAEAPVVVLDEATAGLDPAGRDAVFALLRGLAADGGAAVLVVDHDTELLAEHADRILVLAHGRLVMDGPPDRVLADVAALERAGVRAPDVARVVAAVRPEAAERPPVTLEAAIRRMADGA